MDKRKSYAKARLNYRIAKLELDYAEALYKDFPIHHITSHTKMKYGSPSINVGTDKWLLLDFGQNSLTVLDEFNQEICWIYNDLNIDEESNLIAAENKLSQGKDITSSCLNTLRIFKPEKSGLLSIPSLCKHLSPENRAGYWIKYMKTKINVYLSHKDLWR